MRGLLVLVVGLTVAAALAPAGGAVRSSSCPRGLLPLGANSISAAAAAAFAHEARSSRPLVVAASLASADERGQIARRECGRTVLERTVVVHIQLRAFLPSASLSERVSFVGRFAGGYRVWQIAH